MCGSDEPQSPLSKAASICDSCGDDGAGASDMQSNGEVLCSVLRTGASSAQSGGRGPQWAQLLSRQLLAPGRSRSEEKVPAVISATWDKG